jgi:uncharacterized membrane protein YccC
VNSNRLDQLECVVSVLLSIAAAHLLGATNVAWAAFAGLLVMRGHAVDTLHRGLLRIAGTVCGGALSLLLVPLLTGSLAVGAIGLFVAGTATIYMALTARRAYAWLILGLTFIMVLLDKVEHPHAELAAFVRARLTENATGTVVCVVVSLVSTLTLRRWWPAARVPAMESLGWHPDAFRHAVQGGLALAALVLIASMMPLPAVAQSAIAIVAVMLVPAADLQASSLSPVTNRLFFRFVGCVAGGLFGYGFVLLADGAGAALMAATALGVAIGKYWENGTHGHRYAGTQFTFAVLITLVPDDFAHATAGPGWERLLAVFIGMAMIEPVLLASHAQGLFRSRGKRAAQELAETFRAEPPSNSARSTFRRSRADPGHANEQESRLEAGQHRAMVPSKAKQRMAAAVPNEILD